MKNVLFRRLWLLVAVLLVAGKAAAQAPGWAWAENPGGGGGYSTAVDASGNVYVTGEFFGIATFGTITLTSTGPRNTFVAMRTARGFWQWATSVDGTGGSGGSGVALSSSGEVIVTGVFNGTATFGAATLTSTGSLDIFVAKLTMGGAWQWATSAGSSGVDQSRGVTVDGSGHVVVTGYFDSPTATFGSTVLTNPGAAGRYDIFVAKLTPAGAWEWAVRAGGSNTDSGEGVVVTSTNDVVVTGFFVGLATFGPFTLTATATPPNYPNAFVAKLTAAGAWAWATGADNSGGRSVAVSTNDSIVVVGSLSGSVPVTFGATTLTNTGPANTADVFVAHLTPTGAWQRATSAGGTGDEITRGGALDGSGNMVVTGAFYSPTATFGATTLTNTNLSEVFVAKLTRGGAWQWAAQAGGSNREEGTGVAVDGNANVVVTGFSFSSVFTFGSTTLTHPAGSEAIFLARLSSANGLPEDGSSLLTLTPNPAHHTTTLTGTTAPTATLFDGLGRVVRTAPVTAGAATFDVRGLAAGLYVVRAGGAARRLVVE